MNAFAHIPESELDPILQCFIQGRDSDPQDEKARVVKFRNELRQRLPSARVIAIPNAGKRGQAAINQAKAEGAAWGFPDLMVMHEGKIAFLEFKNGRSMPKRHQVEWLNWIMDAGFPVAVVRTSGGAIWFLKQKGWPL